MLSLSSTRAVDAVRLLEGESVSERSSRRGADLEDRVVDAVSCTPPLVHVRRHRVSTPE